MAADGHQRKSGGLPPLFFCAPGMGSAVLRCADAVPNWPLAVLQCPSFFHTNMLLTPRPPLGRAVGAGPLAPLTFLASPAFFFAALVASFIPLMASAQSVLAQGPAGQVTDADVAADAATRISDAARATVLSRPGQVGQLAANVYLQRAMALQAERQGLAQGPEAAAALALAREKTLADLYLADFDKRHQPDDAALLAYAQSTYRAMDDKQLAAPERIRVKHLLVKEKSPEKRALIEQWLAEAKAGKDFAQLAKDHSEDNASAAQGGDLGFLTDGSTVPPFEQAMKALKEPGDLSEVVETSFGYHIIRLEERRPAGLRGFDEVRDQLRLQARNALLREARAKDAQRLQEEMQIDETAVSSFSSRFKPEDAAR
ncbi:peptidylprolyl isomerase [Verminephrobacter eiseniae]|nr:peptidylprolyl isomerase [Verminephrobacter eiseniae]